MVQMKLAALRQVAAQNEEAENANENIDKADSEAIQAVRL